MPGPRYPIPAPVARRPVNPPRPRARPEVVFRQPVQRTRAEALQHNIALIQHELVSRFSGRKLDRLTPEQAQYQQIMRDPAAYARYVPNYNAAVQRLNQAQQQLAAEQNAAIPNFRPDAAWIAEQQRCAPALASLRCLTCLAELHKSFKDNWVSKWSSCHQQT